MLAAYTVRLVKCLNEDGQAIVYADEARSHIAARQRLYRAADVAGVRITTSLRYDRYSSPYFIARVVHGKR